MNRTALTLIGLLAFAILALWCLGRAGAIQDRLRDQVGERLAAAGLGGVEVSVDGLAVTLSGTLPTAEGRAEARRVAAAHPGVRRLDDRLAVTRAVDPPVSKPLEPARATAANLAGLLAERPVEFASDSAELTADGRQVLDEAVRLLTSTPAARFLIEGHTDAQASEDHNLDLSRRRAAAVRDHLAAAGLDAGRFEIAGFGESRPVASNDTAEGRRLNRRVVLRLLE